MRLIFPSFTAALLAIGCPATASFNFNTNDFYLANDAPVISQFTPNGQLVGTLNMSNVDVFKGMAFGPNGLFYTQIWYDGNPSVLALNDDFSVAAQYPISTFVGGNVSSGKLAISDKYLFVAGGNSLVRFNLGDTTSETVIRTENGMFDVDILPDGNLLIASSYEIRVVNTNGDLIRDVDPDVGLGDIRGVEYDPATNDLFVTHLGYTGFSFRLMRFDFDSVELEDDIYHWYANDLFLTSDDNLLVGSWTQPTALFTKDLQLIETYGPDDNLFVTQNYNTVPEPTSAALLGMAIASLSIRYRKSRELN